LNLFSASRWPPSVPARRVQLDVQFRF
jgi:hypothetical protein